MKHFLKHFPALTIGPAILAGLAFSGTLRAEELVVGDTSGSPGGSIVLPVSVVGSATITGMQFDLVFPASQASVLVPSVEAPGSDHRTLAREIAAGRQRMVIYSPTNRALPVNALLSVPVTLTTSSPGGGPNFTVQNIRFITTGGQTVTPTASYGALAYWRKLYFSPAELNDPLVVGDNQDADGDGIPNLLEFASGGNPKVQDPEARRPLASSRMEGGKQYLVLRYRESAELESASLQVEAGTDLKTWLTQPRGVPTGVTDATSIELETKLELTGPAKFLRLKVRRSLAQP